MRKNVHFFKYQGAGNDFILLDNRKKEYDFLECSQIAQMCDRKFGIGADGLMLLNSDTNYPFSMTYHNSDGLIGSMCGNGGRCISAFAKDLAIFDKKVLFNAVDGLHFAEILSGITGKYLIQLKMQDVPDFQVLPEKKYILNTGSPHYVQFVKDVESIDVYKEGRKIRFSPDFPEGINVNFVEIRQEDLRVRTYERGVENETLSCGTGATASVLAYLAMNKRDQGLHSVNVSTRGGHLKIQTNIAFQDLNDETKTKLRKNIKTVFQEIYLEGLACFVFEGDITIDV